MEVEAIVNNSGNFSDNYVQNILDESHNVTIRSSELLSRLFPRLSTNLSGITDNLILTSASNVNPEILETCRISCVISCAPELPDPPLRNDLVYYKVDVADSGCSGIFSYFDKAANLIQQVSNLGGKILIYCVAGVSRSACICLAYLMKHHRLSLLDAYNFVKLRRSRIKPNCGFFRQLIEYEKQLFGCNTVQMVYNEVVRMEIPDVYDKDYRHITNYVKKINNRRC
ncbi:unnamed protein product [Phyllotreta striolata]|uniref:Uncharacterized protein n=1 Tax=Phyllotreta striolata TaxID=444603 RepID=A0A9N9TPH5_PHYSR|nr:unnamed protein product [Phyllotreta striolata]